MEVWCGVRVGECKRESGVTEGKIGWVWRSVRVEVWGSVRVEGGAE